MSFYCVWIEMDVCVLKKSNEYYVFDLVVEVLLNLRKYETWVMFVQYFTS